MATLLLTDTAEPLAEERSSANPFGAAGTAKGIVEDLIGAHGGTLISSSGRQSAARFGVAAQAIECALALQSQLVAHNRDRPTDTRTAARLCGHRSGADDSQDAISEMVL